MNNRFTNRFNAKAALLKVVFAISIIREERAEERRERSGEARL